MAAPNPAPNSVVNRAINPIPNGGVVRPGQSAGTVYRSIATGNVNTRANALRNRVLPRLGLGAPGDDERMAFAVARRAEVRETFANAVREIGDPAFQDAVASFLSAQGAPPQEADELVIRASPLPAEGVEGSKGAVVAALSTALTMILSNQPRELDPNSALIIGVTGNMLGDDGDVASHTIWKSVTPNSVGFMRYLAYTMAGVTPNELENMGFNGGLDLPQTAVNQGSDANHFLPQLDPDSVVITFRRKFGGNAFNQIMAQGGFLNVVVGVDVGISFADLGLFHTKEFHLARRYHKGGVDGSSATMYNAGTEAAPRMTSKKRKRATATTPSLENTAIAAVTSQVYKNKWSEWKPGDMKEVMVTPGGKAMWEKAQDAAIEGLWEAKTVAAFAAKLDKGKALAAVTEKIMDAVPEQFAPINELLHQLDCLGVALAVSLNDAGRDDLIEETLAIYNTCRTVVTSPYFPKSKLSALAKDLGFTIMLRNLRVKKGGSVKADPAEEFAPVGTPKATVRICFIDSHYFADVKTRITKAGILNIAEIADVIGHERPAVIADKICRFRRFKRRGEDLPPVIECFSRKDLESGDKYATSVDIMREFLYGGAKVLTRPISIDEALEKLDIFSVAAEVLNKTKVLPFSNDPAKFAKYVSENTKECKKHVPVLVYMGPPTETMKKGVKLSSIGMGKKIYEEIHYSAPVRGTERQYLGDKEELYEESAIEGILSDKMARYHCVRDPETKEVLRKYMYRLPYTTFVWDTETDTSSETEGHTAFGVSITWYEGVLDGKAFDFGRLHKDPGSLVKFNEIVEAATKHGMMIPHKRFFWGETCMQDLVDFVVEPDGIFSDVLLQAIAFNLGYDFGQLASRAKVFPRAWNAGIIKSAKNIDNITSRWTSSKFLEFVKPRSSDGAVGDYPHREIYSFDLCPLTGRQSLAKLAKAYGLGVEKEVFPYGLYKRELIYDEAYCASCPVEDALPHLRATAEDWRAALVRSGALNEDGETWDMKKHAEYYCNRDVELTMAIALKVRGAVAKFKGAEGMDAWRFVSDASTGKEYAKHRGAFLGVYENAGLIRNYIGAAIVGGRGMVAHNYPHSHLNPGVPLEDNDVTSLYPYAMKLIAERFGGFPVGRPKAIPPDLLAAGPAVVNAFLDDREKVHYYVITVEGVQSPWRLPFPVLSAVHEDGGRRFSEEETNGKTLVVERFTWEAARELQKTTCKKVLCGIYWEPAAAADAPPASAIGDVMQDLYELRLKCKKSDPVLADNYKLKMNGTYGTLAMKAILTSWEFIDAKYTAQRTRKGGSESGDEEVSHQSRETARYLARHAGEIRNILYIRGAGDPAAEGGVLVGVEKFKAGADQFRLNHCAAMILGVSKMVISRLGWCVTKLQEKEIIPREHMPFHYTDTDSLHTEIRYRDVIMIKYYEVFGEKIYYDAKDDPGPKKDDETDEEYAVRYAPRAKFLAKYPWMAEKPALGVFHADFEVPGELEGVVKKGATITSRRSVFVGKKMYCHELVAEGSAEGAPPVVWYHMRMKGIPNAALDAFLAANTETYPTPIELFLDIATGARIEFDLLAGGKVSFEHDPSAVKGLRIVSRSSMTRRVARTDDNAKEIVGELEKAKKIIVSRWDGMEEEFAGVRVPCLDI